MTITPSLSMELHVILSDLYQHLEVFDRKGATIACDQLCDFIFQTDAPFPSANAERALQQLRSKRLFSQMLQLGDALIQTGNSSYKIKRQYAQALIDTANYTSAITILEQIIAETDNTNPPTVRSKAENIEAKGLLGRTYKQLYVNANNPGSAQSLRYLKLSLRMYLDVYNEDNNNVWHGINAAALAARAQRDALDIPDLPDYTSIAQTILSIIEDRHDDEKANAWDFATAAEANIALGRPEEALRWMSGYLRMPYCEAFDLASTLRQLEEVWQLDLDNASGKLLIPLLRAELLQREGGEVMLDAEDILQQKKMEASITSKYKSLIDDVSKNEMSIALEKVFGADSFQSYRWYMMGADRCLSIARIGIDPTVGMGTGFLLKGKVLKDSLGEELVLITNAHVVSDQPTENAISPKDATITFETLAPNDLFQRPQILWSSPSMLLDATVLRFSPPDQERLQALTRTLKFYSLSDDLPEIKPAASPKVYIIGHPGGGSLQLSLQDNILIDHEDPKIHYRTPTKEGSSGSPVFNQHWDLIGIHHAGSREMQCLNGKPGVYEANEGIWIQTIRKQMAAADIPFEYKKPGK